MWGPLCYMVGTLILLPANTLLFFHEPRLHLASILLFMVSTFILTIAAVLDIAAQCVEKKSEEMSPLVAPVRVKPRVPLTTIVVLAAYLLGGLLFFGGSTLFLPYFSSSIATVGIWLFRFGSVSYSVGSITMLILLRNTRVVWLKASLSVYLFGSAAFICGGILSQIGDSLASTSVWMAGSGGFAAGGLLGYIHCKVIY